jgi:ankyrin repeat protein
MALEMGVRIDNVNNYAENALHYSARHSAQPEVFRLLISHGLDINCQNLNGSTALHNAIMNNNQESDYHSYLLSIKTLISLGAGPSIKRRDGQDCYDLARSIDPRGEVLSIIGGEM